MPRHFRKNIRVSYLFFKVRKRILTPKGKKLIWRFLETFEFTSIIVLIASQGSVGVSSQSHSLKNSLSVKCMMYFVLGGVIE